MEYERNKALTSREFEKSSLYANAIINTQSSKNNNKYNLCMTEPKNTKKTIKIIDKSVIKNENEVITSHAELPLLNKKYVLKDINVSKYSKQKNKDKCILIPLFDKNDFYY